METDSNERSENPRSTSDTSDCIDGQATMTDSVSQNHQSDETVKATEMPSNSSVVQQDVYPDERFDSNTSDSINWMMAMSDSGHNFPHICDNMTTAREISSNSTRVSVVNHNIRTEDSVAHERSNSDSSDCIDGQATMSDSSLQNIQSDATMENEGASQDPRALHPLDFKVITSQTKCAKDENKTYKMGSRPKGYALVISNETFTDAAHPARAAGYKDRENLEILFTGLGYDVTVMANLTKEEMETVILKFRNNLDDKNVDSAIVFILTHGEKDNSSNVKLVSSDSDHICSEWVIAQFYGQNCRVLLGKPKLFFFHCSRGEEKEEAVQGSLTCQPSRPEGQTEGIGNEPFKKKSEDVKSTEQCQQIPHKSDIMIVNACAPGSKVLKSEKYCTWFVYYICKVFSENAHNTALIDMLQSVSKKMENPSKKKSGSEEPSVVCYDSLGFNKYFYFNPGLYYE